MKFNQVTYNISLTIIIITAIYTLVYSGLTGVLLCSSVSLLLAAFIEQFEIVAAITVIFAMFYSLFLKKYLRKLEPFQNNPDAIVKRISGMNTNYHPQQQEIKNKRLEPAGVYEPSIEGFQDVQPEVPKEGASQQSSSAPTKLTTNQINQNKVNEVTSAISKKTNQEIEKEEFQSATNSLFKIGKMPSENEDGPKLDAGNTLIKAMESFDSNTISAMTADTKKLLETQKGLMNMLTQMRPVLADGKELLQTFSGMFGGSGMPLKL